MGVHDAYADPFFTTLAHPEPSSSSRWTPSQAPRIMDLNPNGLM